MYYTIKVSLLLSTTLIGSGDESGGEEGDNEEKEGSLKTQQDNLEAEKQALLQNKELLDEVGWVCTVKVQGAWEKTITICLPDH